MVVKRASAVDVIDTTSLDEEIGEVVDGISSSTSGTNSDVEVPSEAEVVSETIKITKTGDYVITGIFNGNVNVKAENVNLFLDNASISAVDAKVISSDYDLVITLIGTSSITNVSEENTKIANAISGSGNLTT